MSINTKEYNRQYYLKNREVNKDKYKRNYHNWLMARYTNYERYVATMYRNIRKRVSQSYEREKYRGLEICSKTEFISFALNSDKLKSLYKNYLENGRIFSQCPSVDRIDNTRGYTIDNIQFITVSENSHKKHFDNIIKGVGIN